MQLAGAKRTLRQLVGGLDLIERDGDRFVARCTRVSRALVQPRLLELEQLLARAAGMPVRLEIVDPDPDAEPQDTPNAAPEQAAAAQGPSLAQIKDDTAKHPLVQAALEAFDAELLNVYPKQPEAPPVKDE